MKKGLLTTLFAAAVSFAGTTAAFAAAPVIATIPDLTIGDLEDNPAGGSDNNYFVFTNAFQFSTKVSDADTTAGALLWSFAEYYDAGSPYTDTQQQFQINGKNPVYVGAAAIAAASPSLLAAKPVSAGGTLTAANQINAGTDFATFRDILFSPTNQTAPFTPAVTPTQATYSATVGKNVVFYVSDPEGNIDEDIIKVKTKDNGFDAISTSWDPKLDQSTFTGWEQSGINSTATDPTQQPGGGAAFDDVDITPGTSPSTGQAEIGTIVRASSGRYRILGWTYPPGIAYPGAGSYVRGKFYIYTNNAVADAVNKYPNFRARLQHGGAVVGVTNYAYGTTGNTGGTGGNFPYNLTDDVTIEQQAGQFLKPSRTATKPSLYRVDFDPVDVPAAGSLPIIPTFESFAFNDPAAATILLTQVTVGTFPALTDAQGTQILSYNRATTAASQGFSSTAVAGSGPTPGITMAGFNAEGNFTPGYKQNVFIVTGAQAAVGTEAVGTTGLMTDTGATNPDYTTRFVVGIIDLIPNLNTARPRIAVGKYYRARFYATSDVATTAAAAGTQRQGNVRFRVQAAKAVVNCYQEFVGAQSTNFNTATGAVGSASNNAYRTNVVAGQALPGINSVNPETDPTLTPAGYDGGWYTVLMPTPLDGDIRRDVDNTGVVSATNFGTLFSAPAAGSASDSPKDIKAGVDVYTNPINLVLNGTTFSGFADANRAKVSLTAVKIYEHNAVDVTDDGGYAY